MGTLPSAEQCQTGSNNLLYGIHHLREEFVWTGSAERLQLERLMREGCLLSAKDVCYGLLEYALKQDEHFREIGEQDRIDDKTIFIIKRS